MSSYDQRLQAGFTELRSFFIMPLINESLTLEHMKNIKNYLWKLTLEQLIIS